MGHLGLPSHGFSRAFRGYTVLYFSSHRTRANFMFSKIACASVALALFTQVAVVPAEAQTSERRARQSTRAPVEQAKPLQADGPLLMLVSLNQQRMFVYDKSGFVVQTRVSTGRPGHETPVGIYSILEKKVDHTSNIYLDAKMPHMQRLTMTGIALHGGVIPGYAASGGCVRLPFDFARKFFNLTDLNQRVVIAPDVQSPVQFEHPFLFTALPSVGAEKPIGDKAETTGEKAVKMGVDVAETLLGVSSAHAATEPAGRTLEGAAEARRAARQGLVDAVTKAGERRTAATAGEKSASQALADARTGAKQARATASSAARVAFKAKTALDSQERKLKSILSRIPKDEAKIRGDKLQELRAQEAAARERIAPLTAEAQSTAEAAKSADEAAKAAERAIATAQENLKAAKAEIKEAAVAETSAKSAVATFDRQEANRELPVSMFISSKTGLIHIRQGFERVLELQATIDNPDVPLDTFVFTATGWKDESKTALTWTATEVNEYSTRLSSLDDDLGSRKKTRKAEQIPQPQQTDTAKAARTLDRIKLPKEASDFIAEVMKPGSTLIVSSYDMARSETRYAGTDFVVQMPEVVAKISKPTPRPKPEVVEESSGGCFFFCSSYSSSPAKKRKVGGAKSTVW